VHLFTSDGLGLGLKNVLLLKKDTDSYRYSVHVRRGGAVKCDDSPSTN